MAQAVKANGRSPSDATSAGRANREQLLGAVSAITTYGAAVAASSGSAAKGQAAVEGLVGSLAHQAVATGLSRSSVVSLIASYTGLPKQVVTRLLAIDEATPKAERAAGSAHNFDTGKYRAVLEANGIPALYAVKLADQAAAKWARTHPRQRSTGRRPPLSPR